MKDNPQVPGADMSNANSTAYPLRLGEIVSYIDHSLMSIGEITIKYQGSKPGTQATETYVATGGSDMFEVLSKNGQSFQIDWSSGTGDLPGPSSFITNDGCYELHINIIEKENGKLQSIENSLMLKEIPMRKCGSWAKDLRSN